LVFHTNTESGKTDDLESDPNINIAFLNSSGEWASISGQADVVTDRDTVRAHYSPSLKAWLGDLGDGTHDGGPEDPRIGVIRVKARTATYALSVGTAVGRGVEMVKGAVTGQAAKVNKLRELNEDELNECMSDFVLAVVSTLSTGRPTPMLGSPGVSFQG
jgi:general stress protein 26